MIALIDGWWGSGKSVLRGLLDGHPEVFVCPIQDSVPGAFARNGDRESWCNFRDTEALRAMLAAKSQYYRIERFANSSQVHADTSKQGRSEMCFNFDFYEFDREFFRRLGGLDAWRPQDIVQLLYSTMHELWSDYPSEQSAVKVHVTMDNNHRSTPDSILGDYENAKLLYVKRDPAGILATRAGRKPVKGDYRSAHWETLTVDQLLCKGEVEAIESMRIKVEGLQTQFPDRVLIVDFEDLVLRTVEIMPEVAEFLNISWHECLNRFTYLGKEVFASNGERFIGKVNDSPENLLEKSEYDQVRYYQKFPGLINIMIRNPKHFPRRLRRIYRGLLRRLML